MDDKIKLLVIVIRSILNQCKNGLSIPAIAKEYREQEGEEIPFRRYGFSTLEQFLRATDEFIFNQSGRELLVRAKLTEKSAHVVKAVLGQKVSKGERKQNSRQNMRFTTSRFSAFNSVRAQPCVPRINQFTAEATSVKPPTPSCGETDDIKLVVRIIRSILNMSKKDLAIPSIVEEYRKREGKVIPRFGYDTLEQFLRSTDEFIFNQSGNGLLVRAKLAQNSAHVVKAVQGQKVGKDERKPNLRQNMKSAPRRNAVNNVRTFLQPSAPRSNQSFAKETSVQPAASSWDNFTISFNVTTNMRTPGTVPNELAMKSAVNVDPPSKAELEANAQPPREREKEDQTDSVSIRRDDSEAKSAEAYESVTAITSICTPIGRMPAEIAPIGRYVVRRRKPTRGRLEPLFELSSPAVKPLQTTETINHIETKRQIVDDSLIHSWHTKLINGILKDASQVVPVKRLTKDNDEVDALMRQNETKKNSIIVIEDTSSEETSEELCRPIISNDFKPTSNDSQSNDVAQIMMSQMESLTLYPMCTDSSDQIAKKLFDLIGQFGSKLEDIQKEFEKLHRKTLPDQWERIVFDNDKKLFTVVDRPVIRVFKKTISAGNRLLLRNR